MAMREENLGLWKYVGVFLAVTVLASFAVFLVTTALEVTAPTPINAIIAMVSAQIAGYFFVKDNGRLPQSAEKWWLIVVCLLASTLTGAAIFALMIVFMPEVGPALYEVFSTLGIGFSIIIVLVTFTIYLGVLYFGFGHLTRMSARSLLK